MHADASNHGLSSLGLQSGMNCSQIGNTWSFYTKLRCSLCAVHAVVYNEGDFPCWLPCLQGKALQETVVSARARASSLVHVGRAPRPCGSPRLGSSSSSSFSSLGQGASHLTCPVLFSPKTQVMASVVGSCLVFASL